MITIFNWWNRKDDWENKRVRKGCHRFNGNRDGITLWVRRVNKVLVRAIVVTLMLSSPIMIIRYLIVWVVLMSIVLAVLMSIAVNNNRIK